MLEDTHTLFSLIYTARCDKSQSEQQPNSQKNLFHAEKLNCCVYKEDQQKKSQYFLILITEASTYLQLNFRIYFYRLFNSPSFICFKCSVNPV